MVQVVGISGESFVADAVHVVVVCDTEGVGPTRGLGARIHTKLLVAVLDVGTDLIVSTVCGVFARGNGGAAIDHVIGIIPFESLGTETLPNITNGIGTTLDVEAQILPFLASFRNTLLEWVAVETEFAPTIKSSLGVNTSGIGSTHIATEAFIHVQTLLEGNAIIAFLTDAVGLARSHGAEGIGAAGEGFTALLVG